MTTTTDKLLKLGACNGALTWMARVELTQRLSAEQCWDRCPVGAWLAWLVARLGFEPEPILRMVAEVLHDHAEGPVAPSVRRDAEWVLQGADEGWCCGSSLGNAWSLRYQPQAFAMCLGVAMEHLNREGSERLLVAVRRMYNYREVYAVLERLT